MTTSFYNISSYSRFNLSERESDITVFIKEYRERINKQLDREEEGARTNFISFAEKRLSFTDIAWFQDNEDRFFKDTANDTLVKQDFLSECGFICCMIYTEDGEAVIVGHSSGMIQAYAIMVDKVIIADYIESINKYYENETHPELWYPMFYEGKTKKPQQPAWLLENYEKFMKGTQNEVAYYRWFFSEMGAITALEYSPNGAHIIVGHSSGLIQMRHGSTGVVLFTLRSIQFPPKPIYALEYSKVEERICYAACMDGAVYRIEIPNLIAPLENPPPFCIRADPALECLNMQFYGTPGTSCCSTPFITQRSPALSLGLTADDTKMVVGYGDTSIKLYDMETQEAILTYKVHKLRLQFIPKKLQRMHFGQVCALKCHKERPFMFATAAWDKTLRIWDTRCKVGCVMTFEGVDVCSNSIDLNRDNCLVGSWQTTEALSVWDLVARKRLNVIRVQNRRPDVDGEYIYACRYWHSTDALNLSIWNSSSNTGLVIDKGTDSWICMDSDVLVTGTRYSPLSIKSKEPKFYDRPTDIGRYNRKGKYAIIGGSGTNCVEVINLHNRYITCSYPAAGTIVALASHQDRIAFGGTATTFNIVKFYDPKHEKEKYEKEVEPDYDYINAEPFFQDSDQDDNESVFAPLSAISQAKSVTVTASSKIL